MPNESDDVAELQRRVEQGDSQALLALFACHRERLKHIVRLRIDDRLRRRVDPSDVLQEAFLDVARRAADYVAAPALPPFLWFRWIAGEKLLALHRRHLGARLDDAGLEVSIHRGGLPQASSASPGRHAPGPAHLADSRGAAFRGAAQDPGRPSTRWTPSTARSSPCGTSRSSATSRPPRSWASRRPPRANRYIRALKRLKDAMGGPDGFLDI